MRPSQKRASITGEKMRSYVLKGLVLTTMCLQAVYADDIPEISLRFYAQWDVGDAMRQKLTEVYGAQRVSFDDEGKATPTMKLCGNQLSRWRRLYELCMSDGCYYCNLGEGSCETGTCGPNNSGCKPYKNAQGLPRCGYQCADYAFISTLP
ncbi:MAG: hypothetical protein ACD_16C00056G0008 [uncultured bacterium]|nr:MAG: hypothetical protein ACD_16C00056G0008 [uncultured bacterium]OFW69459.1 MAG: hypothetical protein A2X70_02120 [Alphaproteobacteria bacterium GWC2_42_16]OFW74176.1 MAG: hypothetical protein A2Z80_01540 [Alphaproteobacteria bacterium GWA2_41_27]OFW84352.1 MAG: hypothetical protein A3E50_07945 [Alphaproteobacteria bacterium RIFCSPHIGHO2_12_FULL_42_100]OFW84730.1 MAG: hypothetical protein A2W06_05495 [Alphaproteobacteria bacterium RBG_16_42_14]OFW90920.1 MAG: hypothetical protein A2W46_055